MFHTLKTKLGLTTVIADELETDVKSCGSNTFALSDNTCPFCGHKDCFKIKQDDDVPLESIYKCFSCDKSGDVVSFIEQTHKITLVEAAYYLAEKYGIKLPSGHSPIQEIFTAAAKYYSGVFKATEAPFPELGGLSPLDYQMGRRDHSAVMLDQINIGWSDGGLVKHLLAAGFNQELILESGLESKRRGKDFLPPKVFIYPHYVRDRVSHFTFKDPLKKVEYQLPNKAKLNGHTFYNSDSITKEGPVIVVEGENDLISVLESGWQSGVIASIGCLSNSQIEWIVVNCANRDMITMFDSDPAGDGYREKVGKVVSKFSSLKQVKVSGVKDIDEFLRAGGDMPGLIDSTQVTSTRKASSGVIDSDGEDGEGTGIVYEKDGSYYKSRFKDGETIPVRLTNFTCELGPIFEKEHKREREITFVRNDGTRSRPVLLGSAEKVSLGKFRELVANSVDGSCYCKEEDLTHIWEYVYSKFKQRIVSVPFSIGRMEDLHGWLFRDFFVTDAGAIYEADETGVIWVNGTNTGIKPISLNTTSAAAALTQKRLDPSIPTLNRSLSDEKIEDFLGKFLDNFSRNLHMKHERLGEVLTIMGFMWAVMYSNQIFKAFSSVPLLFFQGEAGSGKTTIIGWLLELYGMDSPEARTSVGQYNSGVSWSRKMSYYSSLPVFMEEIRADEATRRLDPVIRGFYDRVGRSVATREDFGTREQEIKSVVILGGQDSGLGEATTQRCLKIYIPSSKDPNRDMTTTHSFIEANKGDLSNIGYYWIKNGFNLDIKVALEDINAIQRTLQSVGVNSRTALLHATCGYFGRTLAEKYYPKFDYMSYLIQTAKSVTEHSKDESMLIHFFEKVETLVVGEHPILGGDHIRVEGDIMYMWFHGVYSAVHNRLRSETEDLFTSRALLAALKEEPYFTKDRLDKVMTPGGGTHKVVQLNLTNAPSVLHNIASCMR